MQEKELLAIMEDYLTEQGWPHERVDDEPAFDFELPGKRVALPSYMVVEPKSEQFIYYTLLPFTVPGEARAAVSEFLTRANFELALGNFEMDWEDGETRFRSAFSFRALPLSPAMIHNAIVPAVQAMERFIPGIVNVMKGNDSAAGAMSKIRG